MVKKLINLVVIVKKVVINCIAIVKSIMFNVHLFVNVKNVQIIK